MTRKWMSRKNWPRVLERRDYAADLHLDCFDGYAHLLMIDAVRAPIIVSRYMPEGKTLCLADKGYSWLMMLPRGEDYVVTGQMDEKGEIVQIYVDIIAGSGHEAGDVFFDDIYLDVIMLMDGRVILDDADELEEALACGGITNAQYVHAHEVAARVMSGMESESAREGWKRQVLRVRGELVNRGALYPRSLVPPFPRSLVTP